MTTPSHPLTIGVFDSGFGGLTVLRELLPLIPGARYLYLGDTARLPYGAKSQATIARYAVSSARYLHQQGADLMVIACNTATALALNEIRDALPIPVIGVIEPGAEAARASMQASSKSDVLVLATAATVQSGAYSRALEAVGLSATEKASPLLVPLVEEGWIDHPVTAEVARIYLSEALAASRPDTVLLGCTHYPLIAHVIERTLRDLGSEASIIDSARSTARATATLVAESFPQAVAQLAGHAPELVFYATDSVEKFARLGSSFLGQPIDKVELLDLGG